MKNLSVIRLLTGAFFIALSSVASAQNAGTVTNHAIPLGRGAGVQGYGSLALTSGQIVIGQTSADPQAITPTGDVTINSAGVTAIGANKVTNTQLRQSGALTLIGRSANSAGNVADIQATSGSSCAFIESASSLICGQLATAGLFNNAVTYAKMQQVTANKLLGNSTGSTANVAEVPIATGVATAVGNAPNSAGGFVTSPVPYANLPVGVSDTVIGFWGSTVASALAINNCTNALTYSTSTHTFGCNGTAGTGTVTSSGTPTTGQFAQFTSSTNIQGISPAPITNSLSSNTTITNGGSFIDGPTIAQGTSGTWWASGKVTLTDTAGNNIAKCKLWDGTTVIDSGAQGLFTASVDYTINLSGSLTTPAANIKISCSTTAVSTTTTFRFNDSGASKDSTVSAHRIQ